MTAVPVLYIVSPPYSGSTLLTLLLAAHPAVATIGERGHFHRKILAQSLVGSPDCSCGLPFANCTTWQAIKATTLANLPPAARQLPFSTFQLLKGRRLNRLANALLVRAAVDGWLHRVPPPLNGRFHTALNANAALIRAVLAQADATHFLDASKVVDHALFLAAHPALDVRVIHLLRDGRAQLHSTLCHHPNRDPATAARRWVALVERQRHLLAAAGLPVHTLRYEELCANTETAIATLFQFASRPWAPLPPAPVVDRWHTTEHHIMGNPMRLAPDPTIVDRQRWRDELTPAQLTAFTRHAAPTNAALGYRE